MSKEFYCSYCQKHKKIELLALELGKGRRACTACRPNIKQPTLKTETSGTSQIKGELK